MRRFRIPSIALTVPFILAAAACSSSNEPSGTPQDFTGSYTLVSFSTGTSAGVTPIPGAAGSVTLTATNYTVTFTIPVVGDVSDQGTYTATGTATAGTWTQQSSLDQTLQYTGTYAFDTPTNQLTLDTTAQGVRTVVVLQKT